MESTRNDAGQPAGAKNITSEGAAARSIGSDVSNMAASATQRAREGVQTAYEETKQVVTDAYEKTTETLSNTYDQAMIYGKSNPGKLTLIAFGAGIGFGVLLASGLTGGRRRASRIGEPIIAALSQVAIELLR